MSVPPQLWVAWIGLVAAALTDWTTGRIPNWLTGTMMVLGLGTHVMVGDDPWFGVVGFGAALVLHFGLFAVGVIKAGDAKLMIGFGACVGWSTMVEATLWWFILNLPVGLAVLAYQGRLGNLVAVVRYQALSLLGRPPDEEPPEATITIAGPVFSVAGFVATLTDWLEGVIA